MKITQIAGLALIAIGVAVAVKASEYTPMAPPATFDPSWTPADAGTPVDVEAQASRAIEVSPVYITAKRAPRAVRQTAQCGAFQFRAVAQGPVNGQVRGFCGGAL